MTGRRRRDDDRPDRERLAQLLREQQRERSRSRTPVPQRITAALDIAGQFGPEVDVACGTFEGNPAGDVDAWEDVNDPRLPTREQVELLATLTKHPVVFFYEPWTVPAGTIIVCSRSGPKGRRCQVIDTRPDAKVIPLRPGPIQGELF